MKTIYTQSLFFLMLCPVLISCGQDKSNSKNTTEASDISSKKKEATDKITTVNVSAIIDGKKVLFDKNDPKYKSVVVLLNDAIQLKFTDTKSQVVIVHLYDAKIHESSPITFTSQVASLPRKEQVSVKVKASMLSISHTSDEERINLNSSELMEGDVVLHEFSDDKISINFKGNGFTAGAKKNLFPMEGEIIIENYNIYDGRY